jgi:molybdopterin-guanine dinucleotide biosynthesis protein A
MPGDVDYSQVTLAVLAGGQGRRMGLPKAHLQIRCQPILEYLLDQFSWPGETLLITTPGLEHPPGWKRFNREAVDPVADQGPLRGVLTALENATTPLTVIVTLDMPCIGLEHLQSSLLQLVARPECQGLMFNRLVADQYQIEPFPFACRLSAASVISDHLTAGGRAPRSLLDQPRFISIPSPDHWPASLWTNLNRPEELQKFIESIS